MPWWGWMIFGAILLGSELVVVDAGFYLVFIGFAAAITGLVELAGAGLELWVQWMLFSVLALVLMVVFRKKLYAKLRGFGAGYNAGPAGETIVLEQGLGPGEKGRLNYRGTEWSVLNESNETFPKGCSVRISRVDGLTLKLNAIEEKGKGQ